jgi:hypothetical protein
MSFSAEMKDFFNAFQTTSSVVDAAQRRKISAKKLEQDREFGIDDWASGYSSAQPITLPEYKASATAEVDTGSDSSDDTSTGDDIEIPSVVDPNEGERKVYGPGGTSAYYADGGSVRTGTQKGRLSVDMSKVNKDLIAKWKKTQKDFGRELNVVSAYRDPKRNKKAGGAKKSQHMHGNAFDIDVSGLSKPERLELIKIASANGISGIGVYNNSLHFDVGGRRAWGPNYKNTSIPGWAKDTIGQHMAGKFGGYSRPKTTPSREAAYETPSGPVSALPVDSVEADMPDWRDRLRERLLPSDDGPLTFEGNGGDDQGNAALEEFYSSDGIDVAAIDIPKPAMYRAGDLTATPQPTAYAAAGGSVPWAGQTSYVNRRPSGGGGAMGSYYQSRPYVPRQSVSQLPVEEAKKTAKNPWNDNAMDYILKYQKIYPPEYVNFMNNTGLANTGVAYGPMGQMIYGQASGNFRRDKGGTRDRSGRLRFYDGGAVPEEPVMIDEPPQNPGGAIDDLEGQPALPPAATSAVEDERPRRRATLGDAVEDERPRRRATLGDAIDRGLKFLTRSLGLDRSSSAVGRDEDLTRRRKMLVDGAVGMGEGPPTPDEMNEVFKTVDPNGQLDESLRSIYAMRKGVEFYLKRGDDVKAAKWAANLIQFSNLVSRQYGIDAVKAGKAGDTEGMVQLAIKSYDAIPDGLSVSAKLSGGAVSVTRKDEEGNVVDTYRLTPQQVFQMATGISTGTGYFDALMDVANRGKQPAGTGSKMNPEGRARAARLRFDGVKEYASKEEAQAFEEALAAGDFSMANDIITDAKAKVPKAAPPLTPGQEAAKKTAEVRSTYYEKLFPGIKGEMTEDELAAWQVASEAKEPVALKELYDDVSTRLTKKQQQAQKTKKIAGLRELRADYEEDLSAAQKKALDAAFEESDTDTIDRIYGDIDQVRRDEQRATESETRFNRQQEAITARAEDAEARRAAREKEETRLKAIEDSKLKPPSRRDLYEIEGDVETSIRGLFTQDESVENDYIPGEVDKVLGKGAYSRITSLAVGIAAYNQLPVEDSLSFMTDILVSPEEVKLSKDPAGNLVVDSPSGQVKLPGTDEAKVRSLMGGGVEIKDTWGYGYTTERVRQGGEEAIPTTPAPAPAATSAGKPVPAADMQRYKDALARASADTVNGKAKQDAIRRRMRETAAQEGWSLEGL